MAARGSRSSRRSPSRGGDPVDGASVPFFLADLYACDLLHLAKGLDMGLERPRPGRDSLWEWIVRDLPQSLSAFRLPEEEHIRQISEAGFDWVAITFSVGFGREAELFEEPQLRRLIDLCHRHGLKVLGYISMTNIFVRRFFADIPESKTWLQRDPEGKPIPYRGWETDEQTRFLGCVNNPGFRAHQLEVVRRAVRAGCDGLLVDNVFGLCYCDYCRSAFRSFAVERVGLPRLLPVERLEEADWSRPVIRLTGEFFLESVSRFFGEMRRVARRANSECLCTMNVHPPRWRVQPMFDFPRLVRHCDFIMSEDGTLPASRSFREVFETGRLEELSRSDLGRDNIDHYRYLRAVGGSRPVLFDAHHALEVQPNHARLTLAEAFASGAGLGLAIPPVYSPNRQPLLKAVGEYLRFRREHSHLFDRAQPLAQVAILISHRSLAWCLQRDERGQPCEPLRTPTHLWGFSQALIYHNVPFDYLLEENLSPEVLARYRVLVLPEVVSLGEGAVSAIDSFVRAGGSLVVTGRTGLYDENFRRRREYALAHLTGVRTRRWPGAGRVVRRILGRARIAHLVAPVPRDYLVTSDPRLSRELAALVRWCAHGRSIVRLRNLPGVLVLIWWVPGSAGRGAHRRRRAQHRVEPGRYVCHFLNYARYPGRDEPIERAPVEAVLDLAAWRDDAPTLTGSATLLSPDRPRGRLHLRQGKDRFLIRLSRLWVYSLVVLEAAQPLLAGGETA